MDRSLDSLPVFTAVISRRSWTRAILWGFERFTPSFSVLDCFEVFWCCAALPVLYRYAMKNTTGEKRMGSAKKAPRRLADGQLDDRLRRIDFAKKLIGFAGGWAPIDLLRGHDHR